MATGSCVDVYDYSPCTYVDGNLSCYSTASKVVRALEKNSKNGDLRKVSIGNTDDMDNSQLSRIFAIIYSAASSKVHTIHLENMNRISKIPDGIGRLKKLQSLTVTHMSSLKVLTKNSLNLSSRPKVIQITNTSLSQIRPYAFMGMNYFLIALFLRRDSADLLHRRFEPNADQIVRQSARVVR